MKFLPIMLFSAGFLYGGLISAEPLVIKTDGNYVSSERIQLSDSPDTLYDVTGTFTLSGVPNGPDAYVIVGLVPYGSDGDALQTKNDFSAPFEVEGNGYMSIDTIEFPKDGSIAINRRIKLGGSDLKYVSFVIGAALEKGAILTVSDLKMVPVEGLSGENSSGSASSGGSSAARHIEITDKRISGAFGGSAAVSVKKEKSSSSLIKMPSDMRRVIFVNADTGSDKLSGLRRVRGQADGPKRTIRSALGAVTPGDHIVLQESSSPYEVSSPIKSNSGQKLVIRAEGAVVIKAK